MGQKWQKRLNEAISDSMFLIPIVTPLFLTGEACRDELEKFIEHEKSLGRDDLILPIYFQTSPLLEKPDERKQDRLASEIASRQMYDWRDEADLPLVDPKIRSAVRDLAQSVATALARTVEMPVGNEAHTYIDEPYRRPAATAATAKKVTGLVRDLEAQNEPTKSHKVVLWVDDTPANNTIERESMAAYNIDFVLATSTGQALAKLQDQSFGAIISDMGRPNDSHAGSKPCARAAIRHPISSTQRSGRTRRPRGEEPWCTRHHRPGRRADPYGDQRAGRMTFRRAWTCVTRNRPQACW